MTSPPRQNRAFRLSMTALYMGFSIVLIGAALSIAGKLNPDWVQVAAGFGIVASVACGGAHWTNRTERLPGVRQWGPEPTYDHSIPEGDYRG